jgi:Tol biopolymer transport system component
MARGRIDETGSRKSHRVSRRVLALGILALCGMTGGAGAGEVELVSRIAAERAPDTANAGSGFHSLSADGRYIAFLSAAANLVPDQGASDHFEDIYLRDRTEGTTILVTRSLAPSSSSSGVRTFAPSISADGRFVVFQSEATDLVPGLGDDNEASDIFLYDRLNETMTLVSHASSSRMAVADGMSSGPVLSADGRYVAFVSLSTDLVARQQDSPGTADVFLYDHRSGKVELVSRSASSAARPGNGASGAPAISADGRFIAFNSTATNLFPGQSDANRGKDLFLYDTTSKRTTLITRAGLSPTTTANGNETSFRPPAISANGAFVAYTSNATNLIPGQNSRVRTTSLFLFERSTGRTSLVSHASSSLTTPGNGSVDRYALSADGGTVAFESWAGDLVAGQKDPNGGRDVFLFDRTTGKVALVSRARTSPTTTGNQESFLGGISAGGDSVVFDSRASDLVRRTADSNETFDVFSYDRRSGRTALVSFGASSATRTANGFSAGSRISADGQWIAFSTQASDLASGVRDLNEATDIVLQSQAGDREVLSLRIPELPSATPRGESKAASISGDGRYVVFTSTAAELLPDERDATGGPNVFLHDRVTGEITLVSRLAASPTRPAGGDGPVKISADGRFIAYLGGAGIVPGQADPGGLFLYDRVTGQTTLVDRTAGPTATIANGGIYELEVSADGSWIAFTSDSTEQIGYRNVFLYERASGAITLVSHAAASPAAPAGGLFLKMSADGRYVAFASENVFSLAPEIVFFDDRQPFNVFLYDRSTGKVTLVTRTTASVPTAGEGIPTDLSADGRYLLFSSGAPDLVPGQTGQTGNVFLYDRVSGTTRLVSHAPASPLTGAGGALSGRISADGRFITFAGSGPDLAPGLVDANGSFYDIFFVDLQADRVTLVTRKSGTEATTGNHVSFNPVISADGRFVAFISHSTNLLAGQRESLGGQIFLWDRTTGTLELASRSFADPTIPGNDSSDPFFALSASGGHVAFTSFASNLVPRDYNFAPPYRNASLPDAFVYTAGSPATLSGNGNIDE